MKTVLLVGDPITAERERALLRQNGCTALMVGSGHEALELHRERGARVIVTELDLPDMPAETFVDRIREDSALKRVAILVVCGPGELERQRAARCRSNGVVLRAEMVSTLPGAVAELLSVPARVAYRVLVWVKAKAKPGTSDRAGKGFFGSSRDVSESGARIEAPPGLAEGEVVQCGFFLPGGNAVEAMAEVVRVIAGDGDGVQYGVRWVDLPAPDRDTIQKFVDRSARRVSAGP